MFLLFFCFLFLFFIFCFGFVCLFVSFLFLVFVLMEGKDLLLYIGSNHKCIGRLRLLTECFMLVGSAMSGVIFNMLHELDYCHFLEQ